MKKIFVIIIAGMFAVTLSAANMGQTNETERQKLKNASATVYPKAKDPQTLNEIKNPEMEKTEEEISNEIISQVFCYIPNRIMDFLDMTSIDLKGGAFAGLGFQFTKYFGLGAQYGANAGLYKDVNRQYGIGFERGYQAQLIFLTMENISVTNPIGTVKEFWRHGSNFPDSNAEVYKIGTGARDYWGIEFYAYLLAGVKIGIHPIEIADFFTGLFCYDIVGDDIKLKRY